MPKFNEEAPVFFLDCHKSHSDAIINLLKPKVLVEDFTDEFDIIACLTSLESNKEGMRVFLEEDGNMVYDSDLKRNLIGYVSFVDPRSRYLGTRIIAVEGCVESDNLKDQEYYTMWRIINGICEGPPVIKNNPYHLNFQYFNGKKGKESDVFTVCGTVGKRLEAMDGNFADKEYNKNINSFRVTDTQGNFYGKVYESYHNLCLIKLSSIPTSPLILENGDKVNIWKPLYAI